MQRLDVGVFDCQAAEARERRQRRARIGIRWVVFIDQFAILQLEQSQMRATAGSAPELADSGRRIMKASGAVCLGFATCK